MTAPETPHRAHRWLLLFGLWLLYAAFGLVATSLAPLVANVEKDLVLSHAAMGSIMGAWQLVYIFSAVPSGLLLDRLAPRWSLTIGAVLIAASAVGRGLAFDYWSLLFAVMLFGLGGPIISAGAPKVVAEWFTGRDRGLAMGIYMTGPAIGGVVSLALTHSVLLPGLANDWRNVFFLWSVTTLVASVIWWVIARPRQIQALPPGSRQSSTTSNMLDLLRVPAVRIVLLMSVGVFLFNHGLNNWLPELLRTSGMTLVQAGYWAAVPTLVGILGSLLIPRLATPQRRFSILFSLCVAAATASLLLQIDQDLARLTGLLLQGIARSSLMTVLILTLVELPGIGQARAGIASGLFFSAAEVGGVLGPLGLGILFDLTGGFSLGLGFLTTTAIGLALASLKLSRSAQIGAGQKGN